MNCAEKVNELRSMIYAKLRGRIDVDYWLLDAPYHTNIGDTLIWQGEIEYLKSLQFRNKGTYSFWSLQLPRINNGDLVLFHGGGNLGDLWAEPHEYKKRIMGLFPACRYFIFPQTVYWANADRLKEDAAFFSHFDCTICARDQASYDLLKANFKNDILLVPDMAFCVDMRKCTRRNLKAERPLLLLRTDKELRLSSALDKVRELANVDITDWLTMVEDTDASVWQRRVLSYVRTHPRKLGWIYDFYMRQFYRPAMIRSGVDLISSHTDVYTTRLHACILSVLLGKEHITVFDNSYGKNRGFYDTWLSDCDSVRLIRE